MDNINCNSDTDIVETNTDIDAQYNKGPKPPYISDEIEEVAGARGIDSSLLFFFLILVTLVCQYDIDVEMDTLLWFFLLLVVIYQRFVYN